ncbi:MAG TPA: AbrB/MazE/SpoVT family DNA-binding domain-containing protein [Pseudonocardiaceae bacterium]|nr:AbrB/MazE/SpoVT family DNA-binding domain-containing protein [Pseudonocardiaceae bacterium]
MGTKPRQVEVIVQDGAARIVPAGQPRPRGQCVVEALLGKGDVDLTTDEIMAMTRGD